MAIKSQKTPGIYDIFKKVSNKNYTKNAVLRQDIVSYYYKVIKKEKKDNSFSLWNLSLWLVNNNLEFVTLYEGRRVRDGYKINNTRKRIVSHLKELMYLNLIRSRRTGKAKKVDTDIDIYEYTKGGQLLAWVIKSLNPEQRSDANNEIYDVAVKAFTAHDDSSSITISRFLTKCKEKGLLDKLVEHIQNIIHLDLDPKLKSILDLFDYIFNFGFEGSPAHNELVCLWFETIQELEPEIRKLRVYQLKLAVESKFENNQDGVSRQYEDLRFSLREDYEKIALKGSCLNCKNEWNLGLHYLEYIRIITGNARGAHCPHCNGNESLIIYSNS